MFLIANNNSVMKIFHRLAPRTPTCDAAADYRTLQLYLIRHGEANHNIEEKRAVKMVKEKALQEGWSTDEMHQRMEEARVQTLNDPSLFDAPLSERGMQDARNCRAHLEKLLNEHGNIESQSEDHHHLIPPTRVLVSPLQRALQTADLIFPKMENIHVREELRERMTGHAADSRHHWADLTQRKSFQRFSMNRLHLSSTSRQPSTTQNDFTENLNNEIHEHRQRSTPCARTVEGIEALRERTKLLFQILLDFDDTSIAVVSHKGYLRELERSQFGIKDAPLFENGEMRVYEIRLLTRKAKLLDVKRLL